MEVGSGGCGGGSSGGVVAVKQAISRASLHNIIMSKET